MAASASAPGPLERQRLRLQKDMQGLEQAAVPFLLNVQLITEDDMNLLTGVMVGPEGSNYAGGHFRFRLKFLSEHPFKPPHLHFTTIMRHPNVDSRDGITCHEQMISNWAPSISLVKFFTEIHKLLAQPDYDLPIELDPEKDKSPEAAREFTQRYALPGQ